MRILVVEDEPRISADIKAALVSAGYGCDVSADGEDAWFRGDTEDYDLVVLDLGLPKMDGLAVLKRWRAAGRQMPVLVLTARGAWPERVEGIDAGADDYLAKPFRMEELLARVRALIRRSAGHGSAGHRGRRRSASTRGRCASLQTACRCRCRRWNTGCSPISSITRAASSRPVELIEHLYGDDDAREANALEAVIMRLRRKLGPERDRDPPRLRLSHRGDRRMSLGSLRLRLLFGRRGISFLAAVALAALGLTCLFERHVERWIERRTEAYLDQVVAGMTRAPTGRSRWKHPPPTRASTSPVRSLLASRDRARRAPCCARARCGISSSPCPTRLTAPSSARVPGPGGQSLSFCNARSSFPRGSGAARPRRRGPRRRAR